MPQNPTLPATGAETGQLVHGGFAPTPMGAPAGTVPGNPPAYGPATTLPATGSTPPGAAPTWGGLSTTPGAGVTSIGGAPISTANTNNSFAGDFTQTYGQGVGTVLANTLAGLGTSASNAVSATNAEIEANAARAQANMTASQAAHGVSSDSSTAALATGDFNSQVNQNIASTDAQMQLNEQNTLIQSLFQEGQAHGGDTSWMQTLGAVLSGIGSGNIGAAITGGTNANDGIATVPSSGSSSSSGGMSPTTIASLAAAG